MANKHLPIKERFESRYIPEPMSGCWLWVGAGDVYGSICVNRRPRLAHRVSWEIHRGPIPDGLKACHRCDTPLCVNPDHLFLGTQSQNILDSVAKGRSPQISRRGERHHGAKLDEYAVRSIRASNESQKSLAMIYGVDQSQISNIRRRKSWSHIE